MRHWAVMIGAACVAATAVATPARADMEAVFGNTVISRYADGGWVKHYFERNGGYTAVWSNGRRITARWAQEGERVCLSNIRPSMLLPRFCTAMVSAGVGDTWEARDPLGRRTTNTLLRGRQ